MHTQIYFTWANSVSGSVSNSHISTALSLATVSVQIKGGKNHKPKNKEGQNESLHSSDNPRFFGK